MIGQFYTDIADQTCCPSQSQCTDTGPTRGKSLFPVSAQNGIIAPGEAHICSINFSRISLHLPSEQHQQWSSWTWRVDCWPFPLFVCFFNPYLKLSWMFEHGSLDTCPVLSVFYACDLYFGICACSVALSMFHTERHSKNEIIITKLWDVLNEIPSLHTQGSGPEWCISSMLYSRNTPFWSGTLDMVYTTANSYQRLKNSNSSNTLVRHSALWRQSISTVWDSKFICLFYLSVAVLWILTHSHCLAYPSLECILFIPWTFSK